MTAIIKVREQSAAKGLSALTGIFFIHSRHAETSVLLTRENAVNYNIEVEIDL
jgi:hypothetical protein